MNVSLGPTPGRRLSDAFHRLFSKEKSSVWLIAGLGNPGGAYENTRHNVGFRAIDDIAGRIGAPAQKERFRSLVGEGRLDGEKVVLIKPQTFMNLSGDAVRRAVDYYKADFSKLIVIYDDVDLPLGNIRIRAFGGAGSHNGMRSIADYIGEDAKFPRIRIGIGKQPKTMELSEYVLKRFSREESVIVEKAVGAAAEAALAIIGDGVERAMTAHNPKRR